jgi:hypothetical protein
LSRSAVVPSTSKACRSAGGKGNRAARWYDSWFASLGNSAPVPRPASRTNIVSYTSISSRARVSCSGVRAPSGSSRDSTSARRWAAPTAHREHVRRAVLLGLHLEDFGQSADLLDVWTRFGGAEGLGLGAGAERDDTERSAPRPVGDVIEEVAVALLEDVQRQRHTR